MVVFDGVHWKWTFGNLRILAILKMTSPFLSFPLNYNEISHPEPAKSPEYEKVTFFESIQIYVVNFSFKHFLFECLARRIEISDR